jgi:2-isopropylmalate synthase
MKKERIYLYDSTLRDGGQTSTINFSARDKQKIAVELDKIGIDYIEGGWPGANQTDNEFFSNLPTLDKAKFTAFGMTTRQSINAKDDKSLNNLISSNVSAVCIVGKSWDFHLKNALNITEEQNFSMISDSISHIVKNDKEAIFDAEHFFDGYKSNSKFALSCLEHAYKSGARWIVLCDTNGGSLPDEIYDIILEVKKTIPGINLGIHCHNDGGLALANSIAAVNAGVRQIQGTLNGIGERCGNANLISLIPNLMLKMNFDVGVKEKNLKNLCQISYFLDDLLHKSRDNFAPFVGKFAFAHKGGLHVSAVNKNSKSYEHINPNIVGNKRRIMVSDQAGRSNVISKIKEIGLDIDDKNKIITNLVEEVKLLESQGYAYDNADASFEILVKKSLDILPNYFQLKSFKVFDEFVNVQQGNITSKATIEVIIDKEVKKSNSNAMGPVNALDKALRLVLSKKYPILDKISLSDYKVTILDSSDGTKAKTRVEIRSKDNSGLEWTTIGVSENIVEASFKALRDSINYRLSRK